MLQTYHSPFSRLWIIRFLLLIIVVLAILAGYNHAVVQTWQKKYYRLEKVTQTP